MYHIGIVASALQFELFYTYNLNNEFLLFTRRAFTNKCAMFKIYSFVDKAFFKKVYIILQLALSRREVRIFADPRNISFYAASLLLNVKQVDVLDDGMFTEYFDATGKLDVNTSYPKVKQILLKNLLRKTKLTRLTNSPDSVRSEEYHEVHHVDINPKITSDHSDVQALGITQDDNTLVYIQSSLDGWVPFEVEYDLYRCIIAYSKEKNLKLKFILHRFTNTKIFRESFDIENDIPTIKLESPIEIILAGLHSKVLIGFTLTSAFRSIKNRGLDCAFINFSIDIRKYFHNRQDILKGYYEKLDCEIIRVGEYYD